MNKNLLICLYECLHCKEYCLQFQGIDMPLLLLLGPEALGVYSIAMGSPAVQTSVAGDYDYQVWTWSQNALPIPGGNLMQEVYIVEVDHTSKPAFLSSATTGFINFVVYVLGSEFSPNGAARNWYKIPSHSNFMKGSLLWPFVSQRICSSGLASPSSRLNATCQALLRCPLVWNVLISPMHSIFFSDWKRVSLTRPSWVPKQMAYELKVVWLWWFYCALF